LDWEGAKRRLAAISGGERALDVEEIARVLMERAAALARKVVRDDAVQETLELIQFTLGSQRCAFETRHVHEVFRPGELTRLPGAEAHVLGITNLRGELLPVFDVRELFHAGPAESDDRTRLLVLGRQRPEVCVVADAVHELRVLPTAQLIAHADASASTQSYLRGVTKDALVVIDAAELLESARLWIGDVGESIEERS
jgi:purine-binding chemotaxis protein CheW